jgi:CheY-like chemotaxis protein
MTRILVVEDEGDIRVVVAEVLADAGYAAETAANGLEALVRMRAARPDAVVLDLSMPVMDGRSFVQAMRGEPALASVPIVVVSAAYGLDGMCADLKVEESVLKPFDIDTLLSAVERLTDRAFA